MKYISHHKFYYLRFKLKRSLFIFWIALEILLSLSEGNLTHLEKLFLKEHKNMLYPMNSGINFTFSIRDQTIIYGIIC